MTVDLKAIGDEFLNQCGPCDFGLPASCTCSKRDYRPAMLELVREVERLRAVMVDVALRQEKRAADGDSPFDCRAMCEFAEELRAAVNQ